MRPHLSTCRHSAFCANNLTHNDSFKVLFSNHPNFYNFFPQSFHIENDWKNRGINPSQDCYLLLVTTLVVDIPLCSY